MAATSSGAFPSLQLGTRSVRLLGMWGHYVGTTNVGSRVPAYALFICAVQEGTHCNEYCRRPR
jgi:hypothetical protein